MFWARLLHLQPVRYFLRPSRTASQNLLRDGILQKSQRFPLRYRGPYFLMSTRVPETYVKGTSTEPGGAPHPPLRAAPPSDLHGPCVQERQQAHTTKRRKISSKGLTIILSNLIFFHLFWVPLLFPCRPGARTPVLQEALAIRNTADGSPTQGLPPETRTRCLAGASHTAILIASGRHTPIFMPRS